jgi:hypothetical protein
MCCGKTKAGDIRTLVEAHLTGEGRVDKLTSLETALREHRHLYTQDQYRKYGAVVMGTVRERAGKNAKCAVDRLELHCMLFAKNPLWSLIVPSGEAPAPPEVLPDALVLGAASRTKLTLRIAEDQLSEAEELGIGTESVEVEGEWEDWPAEKQKFVAEVGRMNIIDAQVEFLRRLGEAARLQEAGSDLRLATAEQVKGWRNILAPERVDLTGDEGEGDSGPDLRLAGADAGDDGLAGLTSLTARATIGSVPETSTAVDFRAFVQATTRLQQEIANAVNLSASRPSTEVPKDREPSSMWKKITQHLLETAGAAHASSDIPHLVGGFIPGARTKSQLGALHGTKDSLLTGQAAPERDHVARYERQLDDEADAAAKGRSRTCNPVCYQCTSDRIEVTRKGNGRGMEEVFSASEWKQHQVHMSRSDAVTCTLSQHGSGSASLYCGPAVGVATVCVLCHHPQFIQGLPSPVCANCGVSYVEPIKGNFEPKTRKAPLGIGKKELIAATMAAMVGGGGDWVQREQLPDKMMESLCRAFQHPRDEMTRYSRLAVMVWCGCRLDCGLHPEFVTELKDKAGRYSAPFTSLPHMDLCLHARLFQSTSDRMKPFKVSTKDGGMNPTAADLKAAALKELKSVPDWPWRKDPSFQYESGVILLLGATRNYFDFMVNLFGEGHRRDFDETFATLNTLLNLPSFGRKLSKAEFYCNVPVAEWAHRMRHQFDPESTLGNLLYHHEVQAGSSVPRVCLSLGLRPIVELDYHTAMRDRDGRDDWIFPSGDAGPPSTRKPVCNFSGEATNPILAPGGIVRITVKSEGFVPVKRRVLERNHTRASGEKGDGPVCLDFQSCDGCPHDNCSKNHIRTLLTPEQFLYCLGKGGLCGHPLQVEELRRALPEIAAPREDHQALTRRFLETMQDVIQPSKTIVNTEPLALREACWVEVPLLPSTPVPLVTRGALEITAVSALYVGRGPQVLIGGVCHDVGSDIHTPYWSLGRQCVLRSLVADLEPPIQQAVESPSGEGDRGRDGSNAHAVEILQQVIMQLGELDISRLPVDSEIAATYCNSVANASVGWSENLLDLVAPPVLEKYNVLVVSATQTSLTFRYYPSGGTHNGKAVPTDSIGKSGQYAARAAESECIAIVCKPTGSGGRHCTPFKLSPKGFTHNKVIAMLGRYAKCGERGVFVAALQRAGLGVYDRRTCPGSASPEQLRDAQAWFQKTSKSLTVNPQPPVGSVPNGAVPTSGGPAADTRVEPDPAHVPFAVALQGAIQGTRDNLELIDRSNTAETPGAEVFEATLDEAKRVCNLYLKMFVTQARCGKLPHVSGVVEGDAPERVALLYMRREFVREVYDGWAGDKSYYEKSQATVEAAVAPDHGATLWSMFTTGCRSAYAEFRGSKEKGAWFENHPSAETPDARRAIARDMAKQVVLNRGLVFDDTDLEVRRILIAAGVRKSPLATAEKHLEDGRPAMDGRYPLLQKLRTIIDATAKGDERAPNSGIFTLSLLKQQTTDLERCVLAILRVESQGGLLEGSKEDVSDAFRLITTAASEFGNIAIGLPGLVYVPLTLAFGMRHSPAAFEVLSRAVEEVYYRSREGSPECWDAVQRFVDDYFLVVNCAEEEDPDARRRNLREAILAVCGPGGLNAEKSTEGRTRLPVFGVFYDLWRRVVYPNHYKVQKFVELARPFVNWEQRCLTLEQAEKLQGLGNFVFQTTPGIMAVFQSRISAMLAKGASAPTKYGGTVPSPALRGESDEQGWRALRCQLRVMCELVKFQESKLLVKPLEAGLRMPQRLCFPGRETPDNVQEYITDAALEGWAGFWNGFYVRGRYSQESNEKFKLAQRKWCEAIGTDSRCINFRELHTAVTLSSLVAPRHPGSIVRFAIDNRAAEAWLSGSTTDLQHVELLITVNSVIQFLLGIDATCRYVRSEDNRFMDVGSRFDREEEFQHYLTEWEKEHGKPVVQLEVPGFLREMGMGGDEVNYESSPEMWQVLAKLMQHWKDMGVGPYKADELDELTAIFHRCGAAEPLSELALVPPEADPVGPSPARIALGEMKLTRASVFRRLVGGLGKTSLPGDVPGRTTLERRDAVLSHQWEKARRILEVPTRCDHRTTFSLPSGAPRPFSGSIRLWENFCGQSTFGKAVEDMNGGRLVGYTETDPYCRTHLGRTFPNAKGLKDHREATARVLRRLKVNLFVTSPPCMEHSSAHTKRMGGRSETGGWYAKCADEAIKAGVEHIIVECTTGVQERNGCTHSPLEGLVNALQGLYHVQQIIVDTPTVCSPYNGYVAPVHHTRQYVVATLKSFRKDPMDFNVSAGKVLVHDASAIVGKISLGDKYQAMPESDVRQLNRKLRRGGMGRLRKTIQCVARVAGSSETALSEGSFRLRVINPLKGLFTTFTGAVGGDWIVDTLDKHTVVRKPTLSEMAAAYGLRGLAKELREPCEALQSMIGNAVPAPVGDAFVAQVLLDRERGEQSTRAFLPLERPEGPLRRREGPQCRDPFIQGWATIFPASGPQKPPPMEPGRLAKLPPGEPCGGRDDRLPRALRSSGRDQVPKTRTITGTDTPKKPSRGIEKLVTGLGVVNADLLRKVRQHAGDVMRSGISAESTIRYEASLRSYYEFSSAVGQEPLYRTGWGSTNVTESHLAYQRHVVEYLSFLHLVNENKAPTLRSKLSHLSWAHTSTGNDDPLKKHHATYVEAWMRALERREPRSAAGKRPATPDLLMMCFMNVALQTYSAPVYCLSIWAAVLTAWAFMLRSREYVAVPGGGSCPMRWKQVMFRGKDGNTLTGADVANAERVTLRIPSTKNGMQEVTRSIQKTGSGLCCVSALQSLHAGLFGRPDNARTLDPEAPVFIMDLAGTPLRREDINGLIGDTARQMYGDERAKAFRSHSLRHGGASAYAAAGVPLYVIKEFGRWQSEAFMVYITLTIDVLDKHMGQVHAQALLLEERKR